LTISLQYGKITLPLKGAYFLCPAKGNAKYLKKLFEIFVRFINALQKAVEQTFVSLQYCG
jgi:hypothetical protein